MNTENQNEEKLDMENPTETTESQTELSVEEQLKEELHNLTLEIQS